MILYGVLKKALVYSPARYSEMWDALLRLTLLRPWLEAHHNHPYFKTRELLYEYLAKDFIGESVVSFLEFGVFEGASLRFWTTLNSNEDSEFIGFDSFAGLPETWKNLGGTYRQGSFSTNGNPPVIDDRRIKFEIGLFQKTLPSFLNGFVPKGQLVVHCDADLYSSTMFVLCTLHAVMSPGTIILFDDFSSMLNDFRALEDYRSAFLRQYEVLGASGRYYYEHVAIRLLE